MSVTFVQLSDAQVAVGPLLVPLPTGIQAGDLLLLVVSSRGSATADKGFTTWNTVASGTTNRLYFFSKIADGTETGNVTVAAGAIPITGNCGRFTSPNGFDANSLYNWQPLIAATPGSTLVCPSMPNLAGEITLCWARGSGGTVNGSQTITGTNWSITTAIYEPPMMVLAGEKGSASAASSMTARFSNTADWDPRIAGALSVREAPGARGGSGMWFGNNF